VASYIESGKNEFSVRSVMRDAYFIPNTKVIDELLAEFKKRKQHMAVVLDEHGGVDGLVTLEDLIEEIVGEIFDESDLPEPEILEKGEGEVLLDGGVTVDEVNERFSLGIPEGDYDTVAGYLLSELGRMPVQGDQVSLMKGEVKEGEGQGVKLGELSVDRLEGHRIESVKLVLTQPDENEEIEVGNER
jgi:putative hemolysin